MIFRKQTSEVEESDFLFKKLKNGNSEFLENFFDEEQTGLILISHDGSILRINNIARNIFKQQLVDQFPLSQEGNQLVFFDQQRKIFTTDNLPINQVIATGKSVRQVEMGFIYSGKNIQWIEVDCYPVSFDSENMVNLALLIVRERNGRDGVPAAKEENTEMVSLFNNLPGMVYRCENKPGYKMLFVSSGAEQLTGYKAEELIHGFDFESIIAEEYRPLIWKNIQQSNDAQHPFEIIYKITHKNGKYRWVWERGRLINAGGKEYLEGFITDITALREAEEKLRQSEQKYRLMAENAKDVIWTTGPAMTFNYVSPSIEKLTGFQPSEITGKELMFLLHEDSRENADKLLRQHLSSILQGEKVVITSELKHRCKNGNAVWAEVTVTPMHNHKKEFMGFVGVTRDITERRAIRRVLIESEARMRNILETINLIAVSLSSDGTIVFCNEYLANLTGWDQHDILGKNWFDMFIPEEDRKEIRSNIFESLVESGIETNYYENHILTRNKERKLIKWNNTYYRDSSSNTILVTSIGEDVTDARRTEQKVRELNQELEARVKQRTSELEEANRDLEAFAYSVSHDLRAPLRHIDGFVKLVANNLDQIDEKTERYLEKIFSASGRMHQMINDLLSFSRIGRKELAKHPVDLSGLIDEVINELKPEIGDRTIRWEIDAEGIVHADRNLLKMALGNLLSNAIKFTRHEQQAEISIYLKKTGDMHQVSISDNGVGFNPAFADRLFNVFQRLHPETDFEGAGIGLANVKRIVQKHGGNIWTEAEIDRGACFTFTLPCGE